MTNKTLQIDSTEHKESRYDKILQDITTNTLAKLSLKRMKRSEIMNIASTTMDGVEIDIKNFDTITLNAQTKRVLDVLVLKLTSQMPYNATAEEVDKNRLVNINIKEFMELCGLKDIKEARKQLKETKKALFEVHIHYENERLKKRVDARLIDAVEEDFDTKRDGNVSFYFTMNMARHLSRAYPMHISLNMFKIDMRRYPHARNMSRAFYVHHNMNKNKKNSNRMSIENILKWLPDMPTHEEVLSDGRQIRQRVIEPFERSLNSLIEYGIITRWIYLNSDGSNIPDDQIAVIKYEDWIGLLIEFELKDYPLQI